MQHLSTGLWEGRMRSHDVGASHFRFAPSERDSSSEQDPSLATSWREELDVGAMPASCLLSTPTGTCAEQLLICGCTAQVVSMSCCNWDTRRALFTSSVSSMLAGAQSNTMSKTLGTAFKADPVWIGGQNLGRRGGTAVTLWRLGRSDPFRRCTFNATASGIDPFVSFKRKTASSALQPMSTNLATLPSNSAVFAACLILAKRLASQRGRPGSGS